MYANYAHKTFSVDFDSDKNYDNFHDSMFDALSTTQSVLDSCNYCDINELSTCNVDKSFTTFYFNNIDGYKTNFQESLINIKSMKKLPSIIAFCETNLKIDDPDNYNISEYNSDIFMLYMIKVKVQVYQYIIMKCISLIVFLV